LVDGENYYAALCEALKRARSYVCITGWQFDTRANLAPEEGKQPREFLQFLNALCEANDELEVFITAWNYSVVYAVEREWFQNIRFALGAHKRVHFRFLDHPERGASHHEKLAIVDGVVAFAGGLDVCDERWDGRAHALDDPRRTNAHGETYGPFHDVQLLLSGEVVATIEDFFWQSWVQAGGKAEDRPESDALSLDDAESLRRARQFGLPLRAPRAALSRTRIEDEGRFEIEELLRRAVGEADRSIYLENQYFTSKAFVKALIARMQDVERTKLDVVFVLPAGGHSKKEEMVLGSRQRLMLWLTRQVASTQGHQLRVLKSCTEDESGRPVATYIHSKLIVVDDRFVSIGSANLMNRSMRVDHELNVSFDVDLCDTQEQKVELEADIRRLRASLLAEHAGMPEPDPVMDSSDMVTLVDLWCSEATSKLRLQEIALPQEDDSFFSTLCDPTGPLDWNCIEDAVDSLFESDQALLKRTARRVGQRFGVVDIDHEKNAAR